MNRRERRYKRDGRRGGREPALLVRNQKRGKRLLSRTNEKRKKDYVKKKKFKSR
jgi:hypothetical protein